MKNNQRVWLWLSAAVSILVGIALVWNDSSAGWFLIIMGTIYIALIPRASRAWEESNSTLGRWGVWGVIGLSLLLVLLFFSSLLWD
jgi:hypothetical protein